MQFVAERPRRIVEALKLPHIVPMPYENRIYMMSVFMGLPIIIHPTGAHIHLGVHTNDVDRSRQLLLDNGFDGNDDPKRSYGLHNSNAHFWKCHITPVEQAIVQGLVPPYDGSLEADELSQLVIHGPRPESLMGHYWRADLLGLIFSMRGIRRHLTGYEGSYEQTLFRELAVVSPIVSYVQPGLPRDKNKIAVQERYMENLFIPRLQEDYLRVQGEEYNIEDRPVRAIVEMRRQPVYKKRHHVNIPDEELEDEDDDTEEKIPCMAREMMEKLNFRVIATRRHREHGTFTLATFCGIVVMIDPSGIRVRFYVNPKVYGRYTHLIEPGELVETPEMLQFLNSSNSTSRCRDWWSHQLTEDERVELTNHFKSYITDKGPPRKLYRGRADANVKKDTSWINGIYWRVELLPNILLRTGKDIPKYEGSDQQKYMKSLLASAPLGHLLGYDAKRPPSIRFTRSYAIGEAGEDHAEERLEDAFGHLGEITRTAGRRHHAADFVQEFEGLGFILHEVKNRKSRIQKADITRLVKDIDENENMTGKTCVAATLISFRSYVSGHGTKPIEIFMAPNGHTIMICLNKVLENDEKHKNDPAKKDQFVRAAELVEEYGDAMKEKGWGPEAEEEVEAS